MVKYIYISPTEIFKLSYELGRKIKKSGFKPDCLLGISRGGLFITRILSDFFDIKDLYIIRVLYYKDIKKTKDRPRLIQDVALKLIKNKKLLVIDDVADTGGSLEFVVNRLKKRGIKSFKIATLHHKSWSKFKPDFFVKKSDKWIIYPWEVGEDIRLIMKKSMTKKQKMKELKETGIPKEYIKLYIK